MLNIPGYRIQNKLYENDMKTYYTAYSDKYAKMVLLKTADMDRANNRTQNRVRYEYDVLSKMDIAGVIKVYEIFEVKNTLVVVQELFEGETLDMVDFSEVGTVALLDLFLTLTEVIDAIHGDGFIHKDINPTNVIWNRATGDLRIIDFDISTRLSVEDAGLMAVHNIEGTLAYIAPEQSGRMNRGIDYRTDYYALGILMYECLTGKRPFDRFRDSMELIHAHMAIKPERPDKLVESIPSALASIVMKLLEKNPDRRYQTGYGLIADLTYCRDNYNRLDDLYEPGLFDTAARFQRPTKLYGRKEESRRLLEIFNQCSNGAFELVMVSGFSGVGKSALINEVHKPMAESRGRFASGKFNQYQNAVPYSAIVEAFSKAIEQILTESDDHIDRWKARFLAGLGKDGQLIIDMIPGLELIIGPQPAVSQQPPEQSRNRFNEVFCNFILSFVSVNETFVLFIDDMQWAEQATLELLNHLLTKDKTHHIMIIGSYRDNEVDDHHLLKKFVQNVRRSGILHEIHLRPLDSKNITSLVSDLFRLPQDRGAELTEYIYRRTEGNPFFINVLLQTLHDKNIIRYNRASDQWEWDSSAMLVQAYDEDITVFMLEMIKGLSEDAIAFLQLASAIGSTFDLASLCVVKDCDLYKSSSSAWEVLEKGLIIPLDEEYRYMGLAGDINPRFRFVHDRIQQGAYDTIPEGDKRELHRRIGRAFLEHYTVNKLEEHLYAIVDHLNYGGVDGFDDETCEQLAELNLRAGIKALNSVAYNESEKYMNNGLAYLQEVAKPTKLNLSYQLRKKKAETVYLLGKFEEALSLFDVLVDDAPDVFERVDIYKLKMLYYNNISDFAENIRLGILALECLGIQMPGYGARNSIDEDYKKELAVYDAVLKMRSIHSLVEVEDTHKKETVYALDILLTMSDAAYLGYPEMLELLTLKQVTMSMRYGNSPKSPNGYVWWAVMLISKGAFREAYEFGRLALEVVQGHNDPFIACRANHMFGGFVRLWRDSLADAIASLKRALQYGISSGDINYANYAATILNRYAYYSGQKLGEVAEEGDQCLAFMKRTKHEGMYMLHNMIQMSNLTYQGLHEGPALHVSDEACINQLAMWEDKQMILQLALYHILMLQQSYLNGDYEAARKHADKAESYKMGIFPQYDIVLIPFYTGLTLCRTYDKEDENSNEIRNRIDRALEQLKSWSKIVPVNIINKYHLLKAEVCRIDGEDDKAADEYELAIKTSGNNGFVQDEALSNELYSGYWKGHSRFRIAEMYMNDGIYAYESWGAVTIADRLRKSMGTNVPARIIRADRTITSTVNGLDGIDIRSILKASEVIFSEMKLTELYRRFIGLVLENTGGEKACFIKASDNDLTLAVEDGTSMNDAVIHDHLLLNDAIGDDGVPLIATSVVDYVKRTGSSVVLSDAASDDLFGNDLYVTANRLKSVLCIPILRYHSLMGIIYVENNLTEGAFTSDRIETVKIIGTQFAISLENAELYSSMEQKVKERTSQLEAFTKKLTYLSNTDQLTNVYNRRKLDEVLAYEHSRVKRYGVAFAVIIADIDSFKSINDTYGHLTGDEVLVRVSRVIKDNVRMTDTVGRWGGEEFMIIAPNTDKASARIVCEKIRRLIEAQKYDSELKVTASFGVAEIQGQEESIDHLIMRTDRALYEAKRLGRNQVCDN